LNGNPISGATSQNYNATQNGNYTVDVTYAFGCATSSEYTYSNNTTNIENLKNNFLMMPNPVKDVLKISVSIDGMKEIKILDLNGRILKTIYSDKSEMIIDCQSLLTGIYILNFIWKDINYQTKFIKE
jgi:hypothetical protein